MALHPLAGKPAPAELLIDTAALLSAYHSVRPDPNVPAQQVAFGTSGHRGTSTNGSFNDDHIAAISQALVEYRASQGVRGPMFIGIDTHALSRPALETALEVLAANEVTVFVAPDGAFTPTPVVSHAILTFNRSKPAGLADGVVITPSHNPPGDGGFKYNPPSGGPADTTATRVIQDRANELLRANLAGVRRAGVAPGRAAGYIREHNFITPYVEDLTNVLDMQAVAASGLKFGVDPLGGSSLPLWEPIKALYGLNLTIVNDRVDPTFSFMSVDHDGKIRMDCSSPYAMAGLIHLKDDFDVAWGNDPDADRHGIVTKHGLMNPNHYLSVAILYLFQHRATWGRGVGIGKTLVSSSMIDRVVHHLRRSLVETPVGFKWFVDGLLEGTLGFGGEESAGASFLRANGQAWSTDKDGIIMDLLAAEITAVTGRNPAEHYHAIEAMFGSPCYERIDAPANAAQKKVLANLSPDLVTATELAGDPITAVLTRAPGNQAPIGGLKVVTEEGWFAARPSGTEDVYKIYAESFRGRGHLHQLQEEAQAIVSAAFSAAGV